MECTIVHISRSDIHKLAVFIDPPSSGLFCNLQYRASPLACAIGNTVLRVLEQEDLMARARDVGALLQRQLLALKAKHRFIGETSGCLVSFWASLASGVSQ